MVRILDYGNNPNPYIWASHRLKQAGNNPAKEMRNMSKYTMKANHWDDDEDEAEVTTHGSKDEVIDQLLWLLNRQGWAVTIQKPNGQVM